MHHVHTQGCVLLKIMPYPYPWIHVKHIHTQKGICILKILFVGVYIFSIVRMYCCQLVGAYNYTIFLECEINKFMMINLKHKVDIPQKSCIFCQLKNSTCVYVLNMVIDIPISLSKSKFLCLCIFVIKGESNTFIFVF